MDPGAQARLLLKDIHVESMQELLNDVRSSQSPCWNTQIPVLDKLLLSLDRTRKPSPLRRGDVLEIQGSPSSGKTHLVYHLLITCILPISVGPYSLGGWGKAAVLFDCDATFDVDRFHTLLFNRLRRLLSGPGPIGQGVDTSRLSLTPDTPQMSEEHMHKLVNECLDRLHIFQQQSSSQLAATLLHLPMHHANSLPDSEIAMVVLDPISGLDYWPDRYEAEQTRESGDGVGLRPITASSSSTAAGINRHPLHYILVALERFRRSHGVVVVLTSWGLNPLLDGSPFFKQHLHPFPAMSSASHPNTVRARPPRASAATSVPTGGTPHAHSVGTVAPIPAPPPRPAPVVNAQPASPTLYPPIAHHITLLSQRIPAFPIETSLTAAFNEEARHRSAVVRRGEVIGLVRSVMAEPGSPFGQFSFHITDNEVIVDKEN